MKILSHAVLIAAVLFASGCMNQQREDMKSPCVGAEGSPCDRRPVNQQVS